MPQEATDTANNKEVTGILSPQRACLPPHWPLGGPRSTAPPLLTSKSWTVPEASSQTSWGCTPRTGQALQGQVGWAGPGTGPPGLKGSWEASFSGWETHVGALSCGLCHPEEKAAQTPCRQHLPGEEGPQANLSYHRGEGFGCSHAGASDGSSVRVPWGKAFWETATAFGAYWVLCRSVCPGIP